MLTMVFECQLAGSVWLRFSSPPQIFSQFLAPSLQQALNLLPWQRGKMPQKQVASTIALPLRIGLHSGSPYLRAALQGQSHRLPEWGYGCPPPRQHMGASSARAFLFQCRFVVARA